MRQVQKSAIVRCQAKLLRCGKQNVRSPRPRRRLLDRRLQVHHRKPVSCKNTRLRVVLTSTSWTAAARRRASGIHAGGCDEEERTVAGAAGVDRSGILLAASGHGRDTRQRAQEGRRPRGCDAAVADRRRAEDGGYVRRSISRSDRASSTRESTYALMDGYDGAPNFYFEVGDLVADDSLADDPEPCGGSAGPQTASAAEPDPSTPTPAPRPASCRRPEATARRGGQLAVDAPGWQGARQSALLHPDVTSAGSSHVAALRFAQGMQCGECPVGWGLLSPVAFSPSPRARKRA